MPSKKEIKYSGATFTPPGLADLLARKILANRSHQKVRVLDPACGEGELLLAIAQRLTKAKVQFELTGYDADTRYLGVARGRLSKLGTNQFTLINGDFLRASTGPLFDIVIANPPYVRTQILGSGQAQALAKKFGLKGRVDLYYPFLIAMTECLKDGGVLGVITSNRFLFTKSGDSIRKYLSEEYSILELLDLGDTKLFDAAVLPAIFIGKKEKTGSKSSAGFTKVYEELNGINENIQDVDSIYDVINAEDPGFYVAKGKKYKKTTGVLKYAHGSGGRWEMQSSDESAWISQIESNAPFRVKDFFKVRVGIKTTADKVFISDTWNTLGENKPEDEILKELISQENIEAWNVSDNTQLKVLYPHYSEGGVRKAIDLDLYPGTKRYLLENKDILKARKYVIEAGREWFGIWVPQNPELWQFPKLVFPDISSTPRFYFDNEGRIVNGNCYWITAVSSDDINNLLLIQGVANSKLMTRYHDLVFNNRLYSGRRRYLTQYVEKYPLPDPSLNVARAIVDIVKELNEAPRKENVLRLSGDLEIKVAEAFDVPPVE
jgi:SAM-dependent methyltransferase